jgi:hypothetical protein
MITFRFTELNWTNHTNTLTQRSIVLTTRTTITRLPLLVMGCLPNSSSHRQAPERTKSRDSRSRPATGRVRDPGGLLIRVSANLNVILQSGNETRLVLSALPLEVTRWTRMTTNGRDRGRYRETERTSVNVIEKEKGTGTDIVVVRETGSVIERGREKGKGIERKIESVGLEMKGMGVDEEL